jgi:hypothetical protein
VPGGKVVGEAAEVAPGVVRGIRAFHGSPYDFERFSMANVGTGEGAQAYGHGLYFAENPAVAEQYQRTVGTNHAQDLAASILEQNGGDKVKARQDYISRLVNANGDMIPADPDVLAAIDKPPGHRYEVNINADPEHFLDWDKPLSEQPEIAKKLQQVVNSIGQTETDVTRDYKTGADFLSDWSDLRSPAVASKEIMQAGIPGIKYLDQGSRGSGIGDAIAKTYGSRESALEVAKQRLEAVNSGPTRAGAAYDRKYWQQAIDELSNPQTHNYVIFDDKLIDIIKKYGMAGLIAANVAHFKTGAGNGNGSE